MQTAALALEQIAYEGAFGRAVLKGFAASPKSLPCRFLYDARGSALFEKITELPEYYLTRTEIGLLEQNAQEIAELASGATALVEFGSGSSRKTRTLLDALNDISAYVPIDIADDALFDAASEIADNYSHLTVLPVHTDFATVSQIPLSLEGPWLGFFPGSTIGNLTPAGAEHFLRHTRRLLGSEGALLVGVDLRKDESVLVPAYNDGSGVTAAFNLNLIERINRELDGDLDSSRFTHQAIWNEPCGRIECYLISDDDQSAEILGKRFHFARGERIHTENSYKYVPDEFRRLAAHAGWSRDEIWIDEKQLFSLHFLRR